MNGDVWIFMKGYLSLPFAFELADSFLLEGSCSHLLYLSA